MYNITKHVVKENITMNITTHLSIKEFAQQIREHTIREAVVINPVNGVVEVYGANEMLLTTFKFRQVV